MSYYDRDGNPIPMTEWANLIESKTAQRVAETTIGDAWVSTVWMGIDHSFGQGPPVIFETMIFRAKDATGELPAAIDDADYQERYCTEAEALAGHDRAVAWVRERI